jgi:hypothetical protein
VHDVVTHGALEVCPHEVVEVLLLHQNLYEARGRGSALSLGQN